jgi:hypothetical protein
MVPFIGLARADQLDTRPAGPATKVNHDAPQYMDMHLKVSINALVHAVKSRSFCVSHEKHIYLNGLETADTSLKQIRTPWIWIAWFM